MICENRGKEEDQKAGIYVEQHFDTLRQLMDKVQKSAKKWKMIGRIAAVLYALIIVKAMISDLSSIANGSCGMGALIGDFSVQILFACGLIYLFTELWFPAVKAKSRYIIDKL